ncbi:hypothetical protein SG34_018515 [Thalassomonas viridans]|uniref:GH18 domain-containing protein n=1 Tax=Thalassomonas viridans TaxID=137584 RepID=A0AAE9Z1B2_9GAMM|nr:glycosyl hydrolase family 18 protein [Thalassomonas viridans]WDE03383.1 hypothetical protein SG34_018515 [Thalassomonas viridans]
MKPGFMTGYLESSGNITFTEAAAQGYDTLIMAFGRIDGSDIGIDNGTFNPSPTPDKLRADIRHAKTEGAENILFSVGGATHNTYNPGTTPPEEIAGSLVKFLNEYGFTGVDFDLEVNCDASYLCRLCREIRKCDNSLMLTAAPQINQTEHGSDLFLVAGADHRIYDLAIENRQFDRLFIQAYNNPWPEVSGYNETELGFIPAAFNNLKRTIPEETLIAIGQPASIKGAGTSIFHGPNAGNNIYQGISKQYQMICKDPQFGGIMEWSINWDKAAGYPFIRAVRNIN